MKKITTFAFALLITVVSFAKPSDSVKGEINATFKKNFRNAQLLGTETHKAFTKLTFKMNDVIMFAFYNNSGELMAVTRNITSSQLPMNLLLSLKNDYSACWITELFEFTGDGISCYYVSLESADARITLRSNGDTWEVYTNTRKQ
ncbi:MAG: hypothetical protein J0H74_16790 [Chitinophagaceae bacterium]|nr:hypothetical protein [Chitinophagaceae bacterium]